MPQILVICGPTATGKTSLALTLSHLFPSVLVSADSRQVYRGMDIGTGKDLPAREVKGYDLVLPDTPFSVTDYTAYARSVIRDCWRQQRLPIMVGGTGWYLKALFHPPDTQGIPPDPELRAELQSLSVPDLQSRLQSADPLRWRGMNDSDRANPRRLIRALEVVGHPPAVAGRPFQAANVLWLGLTRPPAVLDQAIDRRVESRATPAFDREVSRLLADYPHFLDLPAASATGYGEWSRYLAGTLDRSQAVGLWQRRERQYARRQLTWFRKQAGIVWFDVTTPSWEDRVVQLVKTWYAETNAHPL